MPTIEEMRLQLIFYYPGSRWKQKVQKMGANQVIAVWHSYQERKKNKKLDPKVKQLKLFE